MREREFCFAFKYTRGSLTEEKVNPLQPMPTGYIVFTSVGS